MECKWNIQNGEIKQYAFMTSAYHLTAEYDQLKTNRILPWYSHEEFSFNYKAMNNKDNSKQHTDFLFLF